jgi:hypothetical protein
MANGTSGEAATLLHGIESESPDSPSRLGSRHEDGQAQLAIVSLEIDRGCSSWREGSSFLQNKPEVEHPSVVALSIKIKDGPPIQTSCTSAFLRHSACNQSNAGFRRE